MEESEKNVRRAEANRLGRSIGGVHWLHRTAKVCFKNDPEELKQFERYANRRIKALADRMEELRFETNPF